MVMLSMARNAKGFQVREIVIRAVLVLMVDLKAALVRAAPLATLALLLLIPARPALPGIMVFSFIGLIVAGARTELRLNRKARLDTIRDAATKALFVDPFLFGRTPFAPAGIRTVAGNGGVTLFPLIGSPALSADQINHTAILLKWGSRVNMNEVKQ